MLAKGNESKVEYEDGRYIRYGEDQEEFYDFAVQDFLEILTAARNNPIGKETSHLALTDELMAQVLTEKRPEIDFGFIVSLIVKEKE